MTVYMIRDIATGAFRKPNGGYSGRKAAGQIFWRKGCADQWIKPGLEVVTFELKEVPVKDA
jgi:hypothetical protein